MIKKIVTILRIFLLGTCGFLAMCFWWILFIVGISALFIIDGKVDIKSEWTAMWKAIIKMIKGEIKL